MSEKFGGDNFGERELSRLSYLSASLSASPELSLQFVQRIQEAGSKNEHFVVLIDKTVLFLQKKGSSLQTLELLADDKSFYPLNALLRTSLDLAEKDRKYRYELTTSKRYMKVLR